MNPWFDRLIAEAGIEGADGLTREEAALILDLAGAAARGAGARQFAPLATYIAGIAAAATPVAERPALLRRLAEAATRAGTAEQALDL